jgi:Flp pilus assembly protein TadD
MGLVTVEDMVAKLYEVLGLDRSATNEQISARIAEQRRAWRRRTNSPDLEARQIAERRMYLLDEAERVLLHPQRRETYDATGTSAPDAGTSPHSSSIVRALQQISRGQHGAAVITAQRAIEEDPDNAYAYSVLAEAAVGVDDELLASEAIDRALQLEPEDARLHAQHAGILLAANKPARALASLHTAISLDPDQPEYRIHLVQHLLDNGELDQAIVEGEEAYRADPDDGEIRTLLANVLAERAEIAQHELPDGKLVITTKDQASYVESLCDRGLSIEAPDRTVNADLKKQRRYARRAKRRRFSIPNFRKNFKWIIGSGLIATAGICCLPNLAADKTESGTMALAALLTIAAIVTFVAVSYFTAFEPRYVRNATLIKRTVPRRMGTGPNGTPAGSSPAPSYAAVPQSTVGVSASQRHRQARRATRPPEMR